MPLPLFQGVQTDSKIDGNVVESEDRPEDYGASKTVHDESRGKLTKLEIQVSSSSCVVELCPEYVFIFCCCVL